jgi:hypothetical protein
VGADVIDEAHCDDAAALSVAPSFCIHLRTVSPKDSCSRDLSLVVLLIMSGHSSRVAQFRMSHKAGEISQ